MEILFENGRDLVMFDDIEHVANLIQHYLANPLEADAITMSGNRKYQQGHRPGRKIEELHAMLRGEGPPEYAAALERRTTLAPQPWGKLRHRITLYEILQDLHRTNWKLNVLFWKGTEREASDAIDLPRAKLTVLRDPSMGDSHAALTESGVGRSCGRIGWIHES